MPASDEFTIRMEGLQGLQRAFSLADRESSRQLKSSLREAVEPVRSDAERLAASQIRRIGIPWSRMRVGVTQRSVYLAPQKRGTRGRSSRSRPNLATLLLGRAMTPALEQNRDRVIDEVDEMLTDVAQLWGRGG